MQRQPIIGISSELQLEEALARADWVNSLVENKKKLWRQQKKKERLSKQLNRIARQRVIAAGK